MDIQHYLISKTNVVMILGHSESMRAKLKVAMGNAKQMHLSVILLPSLDLIQVDSKAMPIKLFEHLLNTILDRVKIRFSQPRIWLRSWFDGSRKTLGKFSKIKQEFSTVHGFSGLMSFLAQHYDTIEKQIELMIRLEHCDYAILLITNFQAVPLQEQPEIAAIIHRICKGAPINFKILTLEEPCLIRKDISGEIGLQRRHDYVEVRED